MPPAALARGFHRVFAEAGLTPTQFGVLAELADRERTASEPPSQAELARIVMLRPQSVGELVAALVGRGFVVREGPAGRGRRTGLSLTADGRAAVERALPLVRAFNAPDAIGVSAAESTALVGMLRRIRTTLEAAEGAS